MTRVVGPRVVPEATRRSLVDVAEDLFTEHGYAATSLDAIVRGAHVTKGALYHHYSGKQALFEAVLERVEGDATEAIRSSIKEAEDPWHQALAGLHAFLEVVREPAYRRIVIQEGPAVLGFERFREQEERSTFAIVLDIVSAVLAVGHWDLDPEMAETFAGIFFGAMSSAGESVSTADDSDLAARRVETAIGFVLTGLRTLSENGTDHAHDQDATSRR